MSTRSKNLSVSPKIAAFWMFIILVFFFELFFYTWCRVQCTKYGYDFSKIVNEQKQLKKENKEIKIELERLTSPDRITRISREKFGLITPTADQVIVLP